MIDEFEEERNKFAKQMSYHIETPEDLMYWKREFLLYEIRKGIKAGEQWYDSRIYNALIKHIKYDKDMYARMNQATPEQMQELFLIINAQRIEDIHELVIRHMGSIREEALFNAVRLYQRKEAQREEEEKNTKNE